MGKKGIIALSAIGLLCIIGLLVWSNVFLSSEKRNDGKETASSSQIAEGGQAAKEENETGTVGAENMTGKDAVESSKASEKKKASQTDKKSAKDAKADQADSSRSGKESNGKKSSRDKSSSGKKKNSNSNGKNGKDSNSSSGSTGGSGTDSTNSNNPDNGGDNSSDSSKPSQNGTDGIDKNGNSYQSVVSGLTITSEQAECTVSGNKATIKKAGTYTLTGRLNDGQVIIDTEKTSKVVIICKSMSLNCSNSAPFYVKSADKVTLELAAGTTNSITDGSSYHFTTAVKEPDAACYSEDDLTIEGSGTLIVTGKYQDGIASKNDIKIKQGNVQVTAADDGIRGKDGIEISGGSVKVVCQSHALKTTELSRSDKGLVEISGGSVHLDAVGDGIHSTNEIKVSGGNTYIDAKNDGLDTDSSFLMTGGTMVIDGPKTSNHGIFDCGKGAVVNGGTFFAVGSSAMAKPLNSSGSQNALFYKAASEQATETTVKIQNASGKTMYQHKVTRKYQSVIYSAPDLAKGNYSVYRDSVKLGTCKVD